MKARYIYIRMIQNKFLNAMQKIASTITSKFHLDLKLYILIINEQKIKQQ